MAGSFGTSRSSCWASGSTAATRGSPASLAAQRRQGGAGRDPHAHHAHLGDVGAGAAQAVAGDHGRRGGPDRPAVGFKQHERAAGHGRRRPARARSRVPARSARRLPAKGETSFHSRVRTRTTSSIGPAVAETELLDSLAMPDDGSACPSAPELSPVTMRGVHARRESSRQSLPGRDVPEAARRAGRRGHDPDPRPADRHILLAVPTGFPPSTSRAARLPTNARTPGANRSTFSTTAGAVEVRGRTSVLSPPDRVLRHVGQADPKSQQLPELQRARSTRGVSPTSCSTHQKRLPGPA